MFEEKYGGLGLSPFLTVLAIEIMSEYCLGVATSAGAIKLGALPMNTAVQKSKKSNTSRPWQKAKKSPRLHSPSRVRVLTSDRKLTLKKKGDKYEQPEWYQTVDHERRRCGHLHNFCNHRQDQGTTPVFPALWSKRHQGPVIRRTQAEDGHPLLRTPARSSWKTWKCPQKTSLA